MRPQTPEYRAYLESDAWKRFRVKAIKATASRCERCGAWKFDHELQVHHLHYKTLGNESLEDVEVLCLACHEQADKQRQSQTRNRNWNARLNGWASKRYGDDWADTMDVDAVEDEFRDWLDDQGAAW